MRKVLTFFLLFGLFIDVYAENKCTNAQIKAAYAAMPELSYELTHVEDKNDMNGDPLQRFFYMDFHNIPENYKIYIPIGDSYEIVNSSNNRIMISGGVYKLKLYSPECKVPVIEYEVLIPSYKQDCHLYNTCDENIWDDGSFLTKESEFNNVKNKALTITLITILSILIIIIIVLVVLIIIRGKKKYEEI